MWSSTRDRMENNMSLKMEESSTYIRQQVTLIRSELLLRAVQEGLVSIEDICSFPIDWMEMASNYLARHELLSIRSNTFDRNHHQMNSNTSLGLYFDEPCKSSSSSSSPLSSSSRINTTHELMSPSSSSSLSSSRSSSLSSQSITNDQEMENILSMYVQEAIKGSIELPTMPEEYDEPMLFSNLSSASASNEDLTLSSTPSTSMPSTPTFSIRELSSDPESFPNSPIVGSATRSVQGDVLQTFIKPSLPSDQINQINQPLAKRRKVMENFYLSNLSSNTNTSITTNFNSSWPVPIYA